MASNYEVGQKPVPGYELTRFLGRGGFGEVWEATAPGGTRAALKFIHLTGKQGKKEFKAIRLIKNITHPNLVPINALWLKDQHGKIMEDIDFEGMSATQALSITSLQGGQSSRPAVLLIAMGLGEKSLFDRLRECNKQRLPGIPAEELLQYMEGAAKGIDYLNSPTHDLGQGPVAIQHGDIKPQNIMIVGDSAQVCDFGLARVLSDNNHKQSIGKSMAGIAFSAAYASPETLNQAGAVAQTDQYSLGISYYELRTGRLPFPDDSSVMAVMEAHIRGRLDLSGIPEAEREVIARSCAVNPKDRFDNTVKMVRALSRAIENDGEIDRDRPPGGGVESFPPPSPVLRPGQKVGLGYELSECLHKSGKDEVWKAIAPGGNAKPVSLTLLDLQHESRRVDLDALNLIINMEHPHISDLQDYWILDKHNRAITNNLAQQLSGGSALKFVIVGRLARENLLQRLERRQPGKGEGLPAEEIIGYLRQIASALDYLNQPRHRSSAGNVGIQHQNVRPVNIVFADETTVRLSNPSLARVVHGDAVRVPSDSWKPHHAFIAPEVLQGQLTRWSDQFSLALTYLQLRSGALPFDAAESTARLLERLKNNELDLKRLPPAEATVLRRATQSNPQSRFPSSTEFIEALHQAVKSAPAQAPGWGDLPAGGEALPELPDTGAELPAEDQPGTPWGQPSPKSEELPSQPEPAKTRGGWQPKGAKGPSAWSWGQSKPESTQQSPAPKSETRGTMMPGDWSPADLGDFSSEDGGNDLPPAESASPSPWGGDFNSVPSASNRSEANPPAASGFSWGSPGAQENPPQDESWGQPPAEQQPPAQNPWGQPANESPASGSGWGQPTGKPATNPWGFPESASQDQDDKDDYIPQGETGTLKVPAIDPDEDLPRNEDFLPKQDEEPSSLEKLVSEQASSQDWGDAQTFQPPQDQAEELPPVFEPSTVPSQRPPADTLNFFNSFGGESPPEAPEPPPASGDNFFPVGKPQAPIAAGFEGPEHNRDQLAPLACQTGKVVGPKCSLQERLGKTEQVEFWDATGPGGRLVTLTLRDLTPEEAKTLDVQALELITTDQLKHPHIARMRAFWLFDTKGLVINQHIEKFLKSGQPLKLVLGGRHMPRNLQQRLNEYREHDRQMPKEEIIQYIKQLANALDFLNSPRHPWNNQGVGILHQSLDPLSIVFADNGQIQLSNFSQVRLLRGDRIILPKTSAPPHAFAPPETEDYDQPYLTARSDQYSLAMLYLQLRLGVRSDRSEEIKSKVLMQMQFPDPNLPELSPAETQVLKRALHDQPGHRFNHCAEFAQSLSQAIETPPEPPPPPPVQPPPEPKRPPQRQSVATPPAQPSPVPPRGAPPPPQISSLGAGEDSPFSPRGASKPAPEVNPAALSTEKKLRSDLKEGQLIGPGCHLDRLLGKCDPDELWLAGGGGGKTVSLIIHDLEFENEDSIKLDLLSLLRKPEFRHEHLHSLRAFWLLDEKKQPINQNMQVLLNKGSATKLVMGGRTTERTLLDTVEHYRSQRQQMPIPEVRSAIRQVGEALDFLNKPHHVVGNQRVSLVHQNLHPFNIFYNEDGTLRLGNFCHLRVLLHPSMAVEDVGEIPEHPFMSPEVRNGEVTQWSDQYSLALLFLQLRSGLLPREAGDLKAKLLSHLSKAESGLFPIPIQEMSVVNRALSAVPQERYSCCMEFVHAIEQTLPDQEGGNQGFWND